MDELKDSGEVAHLIELLEQTVKAFEKEDGFELGQMSNQTIHSAAITQQTDFITVAVLIYSLNKLLAQKHRISEKLWRNFSIRFSDELQKTIRELKNGNFEEFGRHLDHAKELLVTLAPHQRQDVEEVLKRASINKAGKLFEHGISLNRTAHLLGITPWELVSYIGQGMSMENKYTKTIPVKLRVQKAVDFFK